MPGNLIVIHDELDLPPGSVRVKLGGGLAGHNGLRSIAAHLGSQDFIRIRVGIGKPSGGADAVLRWVLSPPSRSENAVYLEAIEEAAQAAVDVVAHGVQTAMNRHNGST
jgi:PTH1 family peptidyl-tRNA hydrolase